MKLLLKFDPRQVTRYDLMKGVIELEVSQTPPGIFLADSEMGKVESFHVALTDEGSMTLASYASLDV